MTIVVAPDKDLLTIGALARLLCTTPQQIEVACEHAGIPAAQRHNGVFVFACQQVDAIREALRTATTDHPID